MYNAGHFMQYQKSHNLSFLDLVWHYKYHLALYIVVISFITFCILYMIGGVPEELRLVDTNTPIQDVQTDTNTPPVNTSEEVGEELPVHIAINKIGVDVSVSNPISTSTAVLNEYLLRGAVRYPGSGTLAKGNMLIFGHSTGLRIVNNQAFKAFNHLKDLNIDDEIKLQSLTHEYTYRVTLVRLVDSDEALVDLNSKKNMLTLSTCNVFGQKQERFVVEALFVKSRAL